MESPEKILFNQEPRIEWIDRPFRYVSKILRGLVFILLFIMVFTVFSNVICRYLLSSALNWTDEVSRAAFVWLSFIGIVLVMWERGHIGLGNVIVRIHPKAGLAADILGALLKLLFSVYLLLGGWQLVSLTMVQLTEYLAIPCGYIYGIVPVLAFFMFIVGFRDLLLIFKSNGAN